MPELTTAWVTLTASTRGMEADIRRAFNRVERSTKLEPKVDKSKITSEADRAGRTFASKFGSSAKLDPKIDRSKLSSEGDRAGRDFAARFGSSSKGGASAAGSGIGFLLKGGIAGILTMAAGASIAAPFIKGMQAAFETGIDFDRVANNFQGVTSSTIAQTNEMRAAARALGADTSLAGATASDAGKAMLELAKGGLTAEQAMEAARGTMQLAAAGQLDAAEAAKIQSGAMNTFQLDAGDATRVADLLAAAANASAADVSDLGQALTQGGSVAAGFGVSIEDTLTALTMFSRFGINGSDAGTMLKTSLQSITDQSNPAQGAIEQLGLTLYDTQGKFVGVESMMKQVAAASKTMSQEQFQAATNVLFGSDAMRASMVAANGGADAWDSAARDVRRAGASADMAKANMQGLPGVMEGLSNTAESMKLSVYDAFSGMAQAAGGEFLTALDGVADSMRTHKADMIGFFATIGEAAVHTGGVMLAFASGTTRALALLVNAFSDTQGAFLRVGAALKRVTGDTENADKWDAEADAAFGRADSLYAMADAMDTGVDMAKNFGDSIQGIAQKAQESARFTDALGGAIASIEGKDIVLKDNTPEVLANIDQTKYAVEHMPDGKVKLVPLTEEATNEMNAWRRSQGEQPVEISPKLSEAGASQWLANLRALAAGAPVPLAPGAATPVPPGGGLPSLLLPPRAKGGLFGSLPSSAVIQPATEGLVQWAEPSTRGEAFIPLGGGKRSIDIWAKTGQLLGAFEQGGFRLPDAPGTYVVQPDNVMTALQFAQSVSGSPYSYGSAGPTMFDCSGFMSAIYGIVTGQAMPAGQRYLTTESDFTKLGFVPGFDPNSPFNIGVHNGGGGKNSHMAGSLMGYNVESGGASGMTQIGGTAAGPNDPQFENQYHLPGSMAALYGSGSGTYDAPDPKAVREAEQRVADADAKVLIQEQQLAELKSDASKSQRMQQEEDVKKAKRDAADARADLEETRKGKFKEAKGKSTSGGGMGGESLGEGLVSGLLQAIGLDGSLFSNIFEWPNVKSAMAALNWGGGLLNSFMMGGEERGSTDVLGGVGGGGLSGIGLPNIADFLKPIGPQAVNPINPNTTAHGQGGGAAPGPVVQVNGNVGMDPRAFTNRVGAAQDASWRRNMSAVKPA